MAEPVSDPLLDELRDVIDRADPVPATVVAAAKAAFTWRTIDSELAELTADSLLANTGVRATWGRRLLTFEGPGIEVEVEVAETGATRRLTGQVMPVGRADVTVRWAGGSVDVETDDLGRFVADGVAASAVRLEIRGALERPPVVTSWVAI